jgi:hypothetical protein
MAKCISAQEIVVSTFTFKSPDPMMAYVALNRVRTLQGLHSHSLAKITRADADRSIPPLELFDEIQRLERLQPLGLRLPDSELDKLRREHQSRLAAAVQRSGATQRRQQAQAPPSPPTRRRFNRD